MRTEHTTRISRSQKKWRDHYRKSDGETSWNCCDLGRTDGPPIVERISLFLGWMICRRIHERSGRFVAARSFREDEFCEQNLAYFISLLPLSSVTGRCRLDKVYPFLLRELVPYIRAGRSHTWRERSWIPPLNPTIIRLQHFATTHKQVNICTFKISM